MKINIFKSSEESILKSACKQLKLNPKDFEEDDSRFMHDAVVYYGEYDRRLIPGQPLKVGNLTIPTTEDTEVSDDLVYKGKVSVVVLIAIAMDEEEDPEVSLGHVPESPPSIYSKDVKGPGWFARAHLDLSV